MIRPDLSLPIPETIEAAHFIGIGGSGMSGLAGMFLDRGIRVSGSDRADSAALQALAARGSNTRISIPPPGTWSLLSESVFTLRTHRLERECFQPSHTSSGARVFLT